MWLQALLEQAEGAAAAAEARAADAEAARARDGEALAAVRLEARRVECDGDTTRAELEVRAVASALLRCPSFSRCIIGDFLGVRGRVYSP